MKDLEVANVLMRVQIALLRSCAVEVSRENGYDLEEYERPEEAILTSPHLRASPPSPSRLASSAAGWQGTSVRAHVRDHRVPTLARKLPEAPCGCFAVSLPRVWGQCPGLP